MLRFKKKKKGKRSFLWENYRTPKRKRSVNIAGWANRMRSLNREEVMEETSCQGSVVKPWRNECI